MKKPPLFPALLLLAVSGAQAAPLTSPLLLSPWTPGREVRDVRASSYQLTPYLREVGIFAEVSRELDRAWKGARQTGRCNVKTTEVIALTLTKKTDFPKVQASLLGHLGKRASVSALPGAAPLYRVRAPGKTLALSFTRLALSSGEPVLNVRLCRMQS